MTPTHYEIIDLHTRQVVATAKTSAGARRAVDRRDNAYGAYRYRARPVYVTADGQKHTTGRAAYEADLAQRPCYGDGTPRRTWEQLDHVARWSWERNPTPRSTQEAR